MSDKVDDVNNASSSGTAQARKSANDALESAKRVVDRTADRGKALASDATIAASDAVRSAKQTGSEVADFGTTLASEIHAMAHRNPLITVAGAVLLGILIGRMADGRNK